MEGLLIHPFRVSCTDSFNTLQNGTRLTSAMMSLSTRATLNSYGLIRVVDSPAVLKPHRPPCAARRVLRRSIRKRKIQSLSAYEKKDNIKC